MDALIKCELSEVLLNKNNVKLWLACSPKTEFQVPVVAHFIQGSFTDSFGMFMPGLVFVMSVSVFVRLVLVFWSILVVPVLVNWFMVWNFFLCCTGFCTYEKII